MSNFKVGDYVVRTTKAYADIKVGDVGVITSINKNPHGTTIDLSGFTGGYDIRYFKHAKNYIVTQILNDL